MNCSQIHIVRGNRVHDADLEYDVEVLGVLREMVTTARPSTAFPLTPGHTRILLLAVALGLLTFAAIAERSVPPRHDDNQQQGFVLDQSALDGPDMLDGPSKLDSSLPNLAQIVRRLY